MYPNNLKQHEISVHDQLYYHDKCELNDYKYASSKIRE